MKHMNPKVVALLREGFSINTIEKLDTKQVDVLYEKTMKVKKEPKEEVTKTVRQYNLGNKSDKDKFLDASKTVTDKNKINFDPKTDTATVGEGEVTEKSVSKKQQQFFGIVSRMQKGDLPKKGKAGEAAKEMSKKDVEDFASTKHKGLPKKVKSKSEKKEVKNLEESIMKLVSDYLNPETTKKELLNYIKRKK